MTAADIARLCGEVREKSPLVHCITNYVTVNDVANAVLAVGASPIMADDPAEAADITSRADALVINLGTLDARRAEAMMLSGKAANRKGIPVVFDPVGAGASGFRNETARRLTENVKIAVIKGNLSEMSFLAGLEVSSKGVDVSNRDKRFDAAEVAKAVAERFGCAAAVSGAVDVISDGKRLARISNGSEMLSRVTGTGCMTTALAASFAAVSGDMFAAVCAAVCEMGIAGEQAFERSGRLGMGSFHVSLFDALSGIDEAAFLKRARAVFE